MINSYFLYIKTESHHYNCCSPVDWCVIDLISTSATAKEPLPDRLSIFSDTFSDISLSYTFISALHIGHLGASLLNDAGRF